MSELEGCEKRGRAGFRELALFGLGALLALFFGLFRSARAAEPMRLGPAKRVQYWAADRGGNHIFGLDEGFLLRTKKRVHRPLRVVARRDGGAWILHALGSLKEPHGLLRIDEWGTTEAAVTLGEPVDLAIWRGRDALVIERGTGAGGLDRVLRFDASGHETRVFEGAGLACLAVQGDTLLVGNEGGGLVLLELESRGPSSEVRPCGIVPALCLEPASEGDGWWLLSGDSARTITRLGADLVPRWSLPTHLRATSFLACRGSESVWFADETRPVIRQYGPRGRREFQRDATLAGIGRGTERPEGGAVFAAPGALLALDERGLPEPGQGGFQFLVDVDSIPPAR